MCMKGFKENFYEAMVIPTMTSDHIPSLSLVSNIPKKIINVNNKCNNKRFLYLIKYHAKVLNNL